MLQVQSERAEIATRALRTARHKQPISPQNEILKRFHKVQYLEDLLNLDNMNSFKPLKTMSFSKTEMILKNQTMSIYLLP